MLHAKSGQRDVDVLESWSTSTHFDPILRILTYRKGLMAMYKREEALSETRLKEGKKRGNHSLQGSTVLYCISFIWVLMYEFLCTTSYVRVFMREFYVRVLHLLKLQQHRLHLLSLIIYLWLIFIPFFLLFWYFCIFFFTTKFTKDYCLHTDYFKSHHLFNNWLIIN